MVKPIVKLMLPTLRALKSYSTRALPYGAVLNVAEQTAVRSLRLVDSAEHPWESGDEAGLWRPFDGPLRKREWKSEGLRSYPIGYMCCETARHNTIIPGMQ